MIDLETMGNKPNAPIVSIGAVLFEPSSGELGGRFFTGLSALRAQLAAARFLMPIPSCGGCSKARKPERLFATRMRYRFQLH